MKTSGSVLVIDNYDSFTFNLVQYLGQCKADVDVYRNDKITLPEVMDLNPPGILLSPGPCTPKESGVCLDILKSALSGELGQIPIFAVCLGHEAIAEVAGGKVVQAKKIMHGKSSKINHDGLGLYKNMPNPFSAIRYHSLVIDKSISLTDFIVTSTSEGDDEIMGVRHKCLPIEGVQFHPESILTENGLTMVQNFVDQVSSFR